MYREEIRDSAAVAQEIGDAITRVNIGNEIDEDELLQELEDMEQEQLDNKMIGAPVVPVSQVGNGGEKEILIICLEIVYYGLCTDGVNYRDQRQSAGACIESGRRRRGGVEEITGGNDGIEEGIWERLTTDCSGSSLARMHAKAPHCFFVSSYNRSSTKLAYSREEDENWGMVFITMVQLDDLRASQLRLWPTHWKQG